MRSLIKFMATLAWHKFTNQYFKYSIQNRFLRMQPLTVSLLYLSDLPFKRKMYKIILISCTSPATNLLSLYAPNRSLSFHLYFPSSQNELPFKHQLNYVIALFETLQMFPVALYSPAFGSQWTLRFGQSSHTHSTPCPTV